MRYFLFGLFTTSFSFLATTGFAWAAPDIVTLDVMAMTFTFIGGLALFLLGMETMSTALRNLAGERLQSVLARLTTNRFTGVATGTATTALIQSSSVTTVLVVGFVSAGLLSLQQSIGVIFGAEIGTTITAQILAFKITHYALPMIATGLALALLPLRARTQHCGRGLLGLGLIFFGMGFMSQGMAPLRSYPPFIDMMMQVEHPLIGILLAAGFTAVVQSSSVTTGIVITMASQGLITLPAGIALLFGANIGTCITALLASIGRSREAVQAATVHILFNFMGVMIWTVLIGVDTMVSLTNWVSPVSEGLQGTALLAADAPRQLANAHTLFNVINTLMFIPFVAQFAWMARRIVPPVSVQAAPPNTPDAAGPHCDIHWLLDPKWLGEPRKALETARMTIVDTMGQRVLRMYEEILPALLNGDRNALVIVVEMDHEVNTTYRGVVDYLTSLSLNRRLSPDLGKRVTMLLEAARQLENIGDIIKTNLVHLGEENIARGIEFSPFAQDHIVSFHAEVGDALGTCLEALITSDFASAQEVVDYKPKIKELLATASRQQVRQLAHGVGTASSFALEMDIYEQFSRIYYHVKRTAKVMFPSDPSHVLKHIGSRRHNGTRGPKAA